MSLSPSHWMDTIHDLIQGLRLTLIQPKGSDYSDLHEDIAIVRLHNSRHQLSLRKILKGDSLRKSNLLPSRSPSIMVETRKTTRRDPQGESKRSTRIQPPKASRVAPTRQIKRKATQETAQKGETAATGKGKKRVKKELPSYLQRSYDANGPNHNVQLLNIPKEIFDEITSLLEPDRLTCLSLTCKEILSFVGTESWTECRSKRQYWDQTRRLWINFRHLLILLFG